MQDMGTFRATTPERGGFLHPDGTPVASAEQFLESPHRTVELPMDEDPASDQKGRLFIKLLLLLIVVVAILMALFFLLSAITQTPEAGGTNNFNQLLPFIGM